MNSKHIILLINICALTLAVKKTYDNYKVYNVVLKSIQDIESLEILKKNLAVEFWKEYYKVNDNVNVMVAPEDNEKFLNEMKKNKIEFTIIINNMEELIREQMQHPDINVHTHDTKTSFHSLDWLSYHTLDDIYNWLEELEETYPNIVTTVVMGQSVEGRDIKGVKINYNVNRNKTLIGVIEGGLQARAWISPATVTWIIKEFLSSDNKEIRDLAENFEWHIFPVVNPDGYSYTFTDNRMWKKNRRKSVNDTCEPLGSRDDMSNGVDLNKNFDFVWMSTGASNEPCSDIFAGPSAFSEPETRAIARYVLDLKDSGEVIYYIAFDSYGQLMLVPYSHVNDIDVLLAKNYDDMFEVAVRGSDKLSERYGTNYLVGVSSRIMFSMSGTSFDWMKAVADVPLSFLLELRDKSEYGFLLPPEQIIPNGEEIIDALLEMDKTARILKYYEYSGYSASTTLLTSCTLIVSCVLLIFLNNCGK